MEFVDAWIYINLDERNDRKVDIEYQLSLLNIPKEKIHRFSAIKNEKGYLGCSMSHKKVLELILENNF